MCVCVCFFTESKPQIVLFPLLCYMITQSYMYNAFNVNDGNQPSLDVLAANCLKFLFLQCLYHFIIFSNLLKMPL